MIYIEDKCGYPIEMFEKRPFRNAFRWFGLFITGQLRIRFYERKKQNYSEDCKDCNVTQYKEKEIEKG